jgi:hypothetical protein
MRCGDERSVIERFAREAIRLREKAKRMPAGALRDELLKKAARLELIDNWLSSQELKPPS